ncbi:hypothetical protein O2K51_01440 [Apibacter raozihei]|uniref:DUF6850 family outer membrane beta-barrel protein n=1 Tax=Apibacter raozihei TaxID=2500547 RepID=UPI000FE3F1D6|nr:DUF6850 family outer membrane beta-barrel protein [Apibacter raozihei]
MKNAYVSFLIIHLFIFGPCSGQEIDSLNVILLDKYDFNSTIFRDEIALNPANMFYFRQFSSSEISIDYNYEKKNGFYDYTKGSGIDGVKFNAESFQILTPDKHVVWGKAYYSKVNQKNVTFNESSDIENIYPYISADSIGGTLKSETYFFEGGYAYHFNTNKIGILGRYRAQLDFRDVDPRPKNLISDLDIKAGYSKQLTNQFLISANIDFKNYSQSNDVKFVSETGHPVLYHMLGLGNYSYLFTGNIYNTNYNGNAYKAGLQFFNYKKSNFLFSLAFEKFNNEKSEKDSNNKLPMSKLNNKKYQFNLYKKFNLTPSSSFNIHINGFSQKRTGIEYYYSSNGSVKEQIDKKKQYFRTQKGIKLILNYVYKKYKSSYTISSFTDFQSDNEKYIRPYSSQKFTYLFYGVNLGWNQVLSNQTHLLFTTTIGWKKTLNHENKLYTLGLKKSLTEQLNHDFDLKKSEYFYTQANIKLYFKISNVNLFINQTYQSEFYTGKPNYLYTSGVGILF